jgi:hypothetical protein
VNKGFASVFILLIIISGVILFFVIRSKTANEPVQFISQTILSSPTPTPYQFPYKIPRISKNDSYRIILVGDSIVASLGPNANSLRLELIKKYSDSEFVTYNYGYPAMNILTLPDRLIKTTQNSNEQNQAILSQGFELIIIESFAYNPLSELPISEGIAKQTQVLEESIALILQQKPDAVLLFMTPIALSKTNFAKGTYDLNQATRTLWVHERIAYIENHKKFALDKGIPLIDVYQASLKQNGEVDPKYVGHDFIHPSHLGVDLMSKTIANFIYDNKILPR